MKIASGLGVNEDAVRALLKLGRNNYRIFSIAKRGAPNEERIIFQPSLELRAIQKWLLDEILRPSLPIHSIATAYEPGCTILTNAKRHLNSRFLLRIDLKSFFHSITSNDIKNYIANSNLAAFTNWSEQDVHDFCSLVCCDQRLVMGAVTSPTLSNALCYRLDSMLDETAHQRNLVVTRYADDIHFSSCRPQILYETVSEVDRILRSLDLPANLCINHRKTRHYSMRQSRRVTGLVLTSTNKVSIGRDLKRSVRSRIYKLDSLCETEKRSLAGTLAYIRSVEPDFINGLFLKFDPKLVRRAQGRLEYHEGSTAS